MKQVYVCGTQRHLSAAGNGESSHPFPRKGSKQRASQVAGQQKLTASKQRWFSAGRAAKANADHAAIVAARPLKPPGRP